MTQPEERQQPKLQLTPDRVPTPADRARRTLSETGKGSQSGDKKVASERGETKAGSDPRVSDPSQSLTDSVVKESRKANTTGQVKAKHSQKSKRPQVPVYLGTRELRVNLNARVLVHNKEMLDEICHKERISQQQFVEQALEAAFEKHGYSYEKLFAA